MAIINVGDFGDWDTSNVTTMAVMFYDCFKLSSNFSKSSSSRAFPS